MAVSKPSYDCALGTGRTCRNLPFHFPQAYAFRGKERASAPPDSDAGPIPFIASHAPFALALIARPTKAHGYPSGGENNFWVRAGDLVGRL